MSAQTRPVWASESFLRAIWVATSESPAWIAARTDALLEQLQHPFDVEHWWTLDKDRWTGTEAEKARIVRKYVSVSDAYEPPQPEPESGYRLWLLGESPRVRARVEVTAGAISPGGRIPLHHLMIRIRELAEGAVTGDTADAVCAAVVSTWNPSTVTLTDSATSKLARRGNWKISIGYRTWISSEVGAVNQVADALTATQLDSGTMIATPDDWPAQRVVDAMTATLAANGLDEVPH